MAVGTNDRAQTRRDGVECPIMIMPTCTQDSHLGPQSLHADQHMTRRRAVNGYGDLRYLGTRGDYTPPKL